MRLSLMLAGLALFLPGCNDDNVGVPVVVVSGQSAVTLGRTEQLTATTRNASDTGYLWSTSDPVVAGIDQSGVVTGRATGQAMITATGNRTSALGSLLVTVSAVPGTGAPFEDEWGNSPHNDITSEAFARWTGPISTSCAKCHSTHGFRDFLGDDGSTPGQVDQAAAIGSTVECAACHNAASAGWDTMAFPSGAVIPNNFAPDALGREATCMECHQGRASTVTVDDAIAGAAPADDDTVMPGVGAIDVHYLPGAATFYAGLARGAYVYAGERYDILWRHVPGYDNCQGCHEPHGTNIRLNDCAQCHNVSTMQDLRDIRMESSKTRDYDGDGNLIEGVYFEVEGVKALLLAAIQEYAREVVGQAIAYDGRWRNDDNDNGIVDTGETTSFSMFTPRLLKATYNYNYAERDGGAYAHNAKFMIQCLRDGIDDLNMAITNKIDVSAADRNDRGHFDSTEEAFRHWDSSGTVPASCAKCHSASRGLEQFLETGGTGDQPASNGFECAVCHTTFNTFETRRILQVTFPGGKMTPMLDPGTPTDDPEMQANTCIQCHQGRTSKKDIDDAIDAFIDDPAANPLGFLNIHNLAAAATLFGTDAMVGYEYDGNTYRAKFGHFSAESSACVFCHSPLNTQHTFLPNDNLNTCNGCHQDLDGSPLTDVKNIRRNRNDDYNGNGLFPGSGAGNEILNDELQPIAAALLLAIQDYAENTGTGSEGQTRAQDPIVHCPDTFPYYFKDTNNNGTCDAGENNFGNRYTDWDGDLLRATHNYQHSQKEPGAWAHNFFYILQLVIDSIDDLGGDTDDYTRP
ncbi:MAG: Ig-like domain-containing protein [Planctomycetota bacterium]